MGQGDMSVKRRDDGRWLADVQPIRGQRFRKLFDTKAEALRYETFILANKTKDAAWNPAAVDRRKLSELVTLWYDLHGHMLKDGSRRKIRLDAMCLRLRNPMAAKLDASAYAHDRRIRSEGGTSPKTLNNELGYLRAVFNELRGPDTRHYCSIHVRRRWLVARRCDGRAGSGGVQGHPLYGRSGAANWRGDF